MNINGYQQYKQQAVDTMTEGEMLIMLFDGIIKHLTSAELALQRKDYGVFSVSAEKAERIIRYLSGSLNMKYDISRDLYRLYDFFLYEMARLQAGRRAEIIADIKPMIIELRDAFKEADRIVASQKNNAGMHEPQTVSAQQ